MPLPAPVTKATRPARSTSSSSSSSRGWSGDSIAHMEAPRSGSCALGDHRRTPRRDHRLQPRPLARVLLATCSGWSCCGGGSTRSPRSSRSSASRRPPGSRSRCSGVPGGEVDVELIEYQGLERRSGSSPPCDHGTGHFCVFVREIDALHAELAAKGVRFRSDGPVEMTGGPNKGGKSLYSLDPDGYIFEFHERPPDVDCLTARPSRGRPIGHRSSSSTGGCA